MTNEVLEYSKLSDQSKELFLLKLPKELMKYKDELMDLKFDHTSLKRGIIIEINGWNYEINMIKPSPSTDTYSFSSLANDGDKIRVLNKYKFVLEMKRVVEIPKFKRPETPNTRVEVPDKVVNYLNYKKKRQLEEEKEQEKSRMSETSNNDRLPKHHHKSPSKSSKSFKKIKTEPIDFYE